MTPLLLHTPATDPTPLFDAFRGNYATELLTAAVAHFRLFDLLAQRPCPAEELRRDLGLAERPAVVLLTALRALGLLITDAAGRLDLSPLARDHLVAASPFDVGDYIRLAADSPGVREMVERLGSNRPPGTEPDKPEAQAKGTARGAAFIYREGIESAMDQEAEARRLTLALAGRAKNVAPFLAARAPLAGARTLLDVGGGSGLYSIACLQQHPGLRAVVLDRPEVLKVAAELAEQHGVADRLECRAGDMFQEALPDADVVLLSNVLHDWDVPQCRALVRRCAAVLHPGGRLLVHDVFLDDDLGGPLPVALYSAALFSLTEGRAYSAAEFRAWLLEAGLTPEPIIPTLVHCGVLPGRK
jgi:predicted O-methyltransferase YrrM